MGLVGLYYVKPCECVPNIQLRSIQGSAAAWTWAQERSKLETQDKRSGISLLLL
jgi:hypothetical protein